MFLVDNDRWQWEVRLPDLRAAIRVGFCAQIAVQIAFSTPVSAAPASTRDKPAARQAWKPARMSVSAVVLPTCSVRFGDDMAGTDNQPVEVRCTRDTDYRLSVARADGAWVTAQPAATTGTETDNSQPLSSQFLIQRAQLLRAADADAMSPTLLSIDF